MQPRRPNIPNAAVGCKICPRDHVRMDWRRRLASKIIAWWSRTRFRILNGCVYLDTMGDQDSWLTARASLHTRARAPRAVSGPLCRSQLDAFHRTRPCGAVEAEDLAVREAALRSRFIELSDGLSCADLRVCGERALGVTSVSIRISKGCLLTPPAIRTRRRIARASSQASCTERCTRQPSPTTQPTPS